MKYETFRSLVQDLPAVSDAHLKLLDGDRQVLRNQISRWQKAGKIVRMRRGLYLLNENDRKIHPSRMFIAGEMYRPSYVSMEFALSFYGLIPERAADVTSVTTRKTATFTNPLGTFTYQNVKKNCFTGFEEHKDEAGLTYFLARPEKAVADFFYLNRHRIRGADRREIEESFRLQNTDQLNRKQLLRYGEVFSSEKLTGILKLVR